VQLYAVVGLYLPDVETVMIHSFQKKPFEVMNKRNRVHTCDWFLRP
jgi:hypothetical protein